MNWKDTLVRAAKTFVQSFVAILIAAQVDGVSDLFDPSLYDQAAVAGVAAVLSFIQNTLNQIDTTKKPPAVDA